MAPIRLRRSFLVVPRKAARGACKDRGSQGLALFLFHWLPKLPYRHYHFRHTLGSLPYELSQFMVDEPQAIWSEGKLAALALSTSAERGEPPAKGPRQGLHLGEIRDAPMHRGTPDAWCTTSAVG